MGLKATKEPVAKIACAIFPPEPLRALTRCYVLAVALSLLFDAIPALGIGVDCDHYSPFNFYPSRSRATLGFSIRSSEMEHTPIWNVRSPPPLPLERAIALAKGAALAATLDYDLKFSDIALRRYGCTPAGHHYYDVVFDTIDRRTKLPMGEYHIIVLLDGSVKMPIPVTIPSEPGT